MDYETANEFLITTFENHSVTCICLGPSSSGAPDLISMGWDSRHSPGAFHRRKPMSRMVVLGGISAARSRCFQHSNAPSTDCSANTRNFADEGGSDFDISASLNGWAPTTSGIRVVHSLEGSGFPTPQVLIGELAAGRPIMIAFQSGPSSGHAVVVTGAGFFATPQGPVISSLIVRDPWPSPDHIHSLGRVQYDGVNLAMFASTVQAFWLVWST